MKRTRPVQRLHHRVALLLDLAVDSCAKSSESDSTCTITLGPRLSCPFWLLVVTIPLFRSFTGSLGRDPCDERCQKTHQALCYEVHLDQPHLPCRYSLSVARLPHSRSCGGRCGKLPEGSCTMAPRDHCRSVRSHHPCKHVHPSWLLDGIQSYIVNAGPQI